MGEADKHFKIISRRQPGDQVFTIGDRRASRISPAELRQQQLQQTLQALTAETRQLSVGTRQTSLELEVHHQQAAITCLLACTISASEAINRKTDGAIALNESDLAQRVERQGLMTPYGLNTTNRRIDTIKFLQTNLGLSITDTVTREPAEMAHGIVSALNHRDIVLLNSAAHWIAIYGLRKTTPDTVQWLVMNPALSALDEISTPELANRLVGDPKYSPTEIPGMGIKGDLLYINIPSTGFRITGLHPAK